MFDVVTFFIDDISLYATGFGKDAAARTTKAFEDISKAVDNLTESVINIADASNSGAQGISEITNSR